MTADCCRLSLYALHELGPAANEGEAPAALGVFGVRALHWVGLFVLDATAVACGTTATAPNSVQTPASPTTAAPTTAAPATPTAPTGGGLTLEAYNKLMTGMSEVEVTAITGPCETSSEMSIGGSTSKTLTCKGSEPFSNAILIFSNGKLASKSQFGLEGSPPTEAKGSMTLAKYNQLAIGQTSAEVRSITGPCDKSSETSIAGHESFALTCYASDGLGNALLLFSGDMLHSKSQFGLK